MTSATLLTPLKVAGYRLTIPPRSGIWRIDPKFSVFELRLRDGRRTSLLTAPVREGQLTLTEPVSTSTIRFRLDAAKLRHGTRRAAGWLQTAGLDNTSGPSLFASDIVLASPRGWRMSGRLRTQRLNELFIADVSIHSVSTHPNGRDAMVLTAVGSLARCRLPGLTQLALGKRVYVRLCADLIHD
jgi:hypothetical protein